MSSPTIDIPLFYINSEKTEKETTARDSEASHK